MDNGKWIFADDGEKYFIKNDMQECHDKLPFGLNQSDEELQSMQQRSKEEIKYKVMTETGIIPIAEPVFNDDIRKLKRRYTFSSFMVNIDFEIHLINAAAIGVAAGIIAIITYSLATGTTPNGNLTDNESILKIFFSSALTGATIYGISACCCGVKAYRLSNYHLQDKQKVWLVNYIDEEVEEAEITGIYTLGEDFNGTRFELQGNSEIRVFGFDLYFSTSDAEKALAFVSENNNRLFSDYLPQWKEDKSFHQFYQQMVGYANRYEKELMLLAEGDEYNGVKNILQKFVEHKKRLKSDKEENEKLKNALSGIERNDKK